MIFRTNNNCKFVVCIWSVFSVRFLLSSRSVGWLCSDICWGDSAWAYDMPSFSPWEVRLVVGD